MGLLKMTNYIGMTFEEAQEKEKNDYCISNKTRLETIPRAPTDMWISVDDLMPPDFKEVMFFYFLENESTKEIVKKDIVCGHYSTGSWHICYLFHSRSLTVNDKVKVTHWKELPEYPI